MELPRKARREHHYLTHRQVSELAIAAGEKGPIVLLLVCGGLRWGAMLRQACAPAGKFKATIAGKSYWGECARRFTADADVPFATDESRPEVVKVSVADRTRFRLLLIPTPPT